LKTRLFNYLRLPLALAAIGNGCAWTGTTEEKIPDLPQPRMSLDSVGLEIGFARWPVEVRQERLWNEIDETPLPPDLRRRLAPNGLRCGVVGTQVPEALRQLLDDKSGQDAVKVESVGQAGTDRAPPWRRLHSRADQRGEIVTSNTSEKLDVLFRKNREIIGHTYRDAQCFFSIRTQPLGDGRARVILPEIHHGNPQRNWAGDTGMWRFDVSRDRKEFEQLRIEVVLVPGESVVVGCTPEIRGLGQHFFVGPDRASQKLLIIRLAQTQQDNLFPTSELAGGGVG